MYKVLCKFLIKVESTCRREIKEQTLQLTSLYCGRTVKSSRRNCSVKKLFLQISQYPQETPMLESLFKIQQHNCFPVDIAKFLRLPILKNICEQLLLDCFNGPLLYGSKGSRSRFYRYLSSWTESRPALRNLRRVIWWVN